MMLRSVSGRVCGRGGHTPLLSLVANGMHKKEAMKKKRKREKKGKGREIQYLSNKKQYIAIVLLNK
jgi:hypothetical protein